MPSTCHLKSVNKIHLRMKKISESRNEKISELVRMYTMCQIHTGIFNILSGLILTVTL